MTKLFFLLVGVALIWLDFQMTGSGERHEAFLEAREAGTHSGTVVELHEREVTRRSGGRRSRRTTTSTQQCPTVRYDTGDGVERRFTEFEECDGDREVGDAVEVVALEDGGAHIDSDRVERSLEDEGQHNWWLLGFAGLCILGALVGLTSRARAAVRS